MKKSSVFTLSILAALLLLPSVMAYISVPAPAPGLLNPIVVPQFFQSGSAWDKAFTFVFGSSIADTGPAFLVWFAVWLIIFVFTADTLNTFSALSKTSSWIIGAGVGIIFSATGLTTMISVWALGITAMLGAASFLVVAVTAFIATVVIHIGYTNKATAWVMNRNALIKQAKELRSSKEAAGEIKGAIEALREVQASLRKPAP